MTWLIGSIALVLIGVILVLSRKLGKTSALLKQARRSNETQEIINSVVEPTVDDLSDTVRRGDY